MKLTPREHQAILNQVPNERYESIMQIKLLALKKYYSKARPETMDDDDEEAIASLAMAKFSDQKLPYDKFGVTVDFERPLAGQATSTASSSSAPSRSAKSEKLVADREEERRKMMVAKIYFADRFWDHIFQGECVDGRGAHTGLHSTAALPKGGEYPKVDKSENDKNGCFTAVVKLRGDKAAKESSFFPGEWSEIQVKSAVEEAIRDSWLNPSAYDDMKRAGGLTWVGCIVGSGGPMFIGGLGGSGRKPSDAVATAFPAVGNRFS